MGGFLDNREEQNINLGIDANFHAKSNFDKIYFAIMLSFKNEN